MVGGQHPVTAGEALTEAAARHLAHAPSASMEDIAREAGVSRATLFRRHPTRAQLVTELSQRAVRAYIGAVDSARPEDGRAQEAMVRLVERLAPLAPTYGLLVLQPLEAAVETALLAEAESCEGRIRDLVRRGQRSGTFTLDLSPEWVLTTITWLVVGAADSLRLGTLAPADLRPFLTTTIISVVRRR